MNSLTKILCATSLTLASFVSGCEEPIQSGFVTNMQYVPAHIERRTRHVHIGISSRHRRYNAQVPDTYKITFEGKNTKGELRIREISIDKEVYSHLKIGDKYPPLELEK